MSSSDLQLEGKVALVVGRGRGISQEICRFLADQGAKVVICERSQAVADDSLGVLHGMGAEGMAIAADYSDKGQVARIFDAVRDRYSVLDIMVHTVASEKALDEQGVSRPRVSETSDGEWQATLGECLNGAFYFTQHALRTMGSQKYGKVVFILARDEINGAFRHPDIAAATTGILAMMCALANPVFARGINMNTIIAGPPMESWTNQMSEARWRRQFQDVLNTKGIDESGGIASLMSYLLSDEANMVTGQIMATNNFVHRWC